MEKDFVLYEEALDLKELEFDGLCFGFYCKETGYILNWKSNSCKPYNHNDSNKYGDISAPLYQQAFRWFRDNYGLFYDNLKYITNEWKYTIYSNDPEDYYQSIGYMSYEEAELECLKKLIEIIKDNKNVK